MSAHEETFIKLYSFIAESAIDSDSKIHLKSINFLDDLLTELQDNKKYTPARQLKLYAHVTRILSLLSTTLRDLNDSKINRRLENVWVRILCSPEIKTNRFYVEFFYLGQSIVLLQQLVLDHGKQCLAGGTINFPLPNTELEGMEPVKLSIYVDNYDKLLSVQTTWCKILSIICLNLETPLYFQPKQFHRIVIEMAYRIRLADVECYSAMCKCVHRLSCNAEYTEVAKTTISQGILGWIQQYNRRLLDFWSAHQETSSKLKAKQIEKERARARMASTDYSDRNNDDSKNASSSSSSSSIASNNKKQQQQMGKRLPTNQRKASMSFMEQVFISGTEMTFTEMNEGFTAATFLLDHLTGKVPDVTRSEALNSIIGDFLKQEIKILVVENRARLKTLVESADFSPTTVVTARDLAMYEEHLQNKYTYNSVSRFASGLLYMLRDCIGMDRELVPDVDFLLRCVLDTTSQQAVSMIIQSCLITSPNICLALLSHFDSIDSVIDDGQEMDVDDDAAKEKVTKGSKRLREEGTSSSSVSKQSSAATKSLDHKDDNDDDGWDRELVEEYDSDSEMECGSLLTDLITLVHAVQRRVKQLAIYTGSSNNSSNQSRRKTLSMENLQEPPEFRSDNVDLEESTTIMFAFEVYTLVCLVNMYLGKPSSEAVDTHHKESYTKNWSNMPSYDMQSIIDWRGKTVVEYAFYQMCFRTMHRLPVSSLTCSAWQVGGPPLVLNGYEQGLASSHNIVSSLFCLHRIMSSASYRQNALLRHFQDNIFNSTPMCILLKSVLQNLAPFFKDITFRYKYNTSTVMKRRDNDNTTVNGIVLREAELTRLAMVYPRLRLAEYPSPLEFRYLDRLLVHEGHHGDQLQTLLLRVWCDVASFPIYSPYPSEVKMKGVSIPLLSIDYKALGTITKVVGLVSYVTKTREVLMQLMTEPLEYRNRRIDAFVSYFVNAFLFTREVFRDRQKPGDFPVIGTVFDCVRFSCSAALSSLYRSFENEFLDCTSVMASFGPLYKFLRIWEEDAMSPIKPAKKLSALHYFKSSFQWMESHQREVRENAQQQHIEMLNTPNTAASSVAEAVPPVCTAGILCDEIVDSFIPVFMVLKAHLHFAIDHGVLYKDDPIDYFARKEKKQNDNDDSQKSNTSQQNAHLPSSTTSSLATEEQNFDPASRYEFSMFVPYAQLFGFPTSPDTFLQHVQWGIQLDLITHLDTLIQIRALAGALHLLGNGNTAAKVKGKIIEECDDMCFKLLNKLPLGVEEDDMDHRLTSRVSTLLTTCMVDASLREGLMDDRSLDTNGAFLPQVRPVGKFSNLLLDIQDINRMQRTYVITTSFFQFVEWTCVTNPNAAIWALACIFRAHFLREPPIPAIPVPALQSVVEEHLLLLRGNEYLQYLMVSNVEVAVQNLLFPVLFDSTNIDHHKVLHEMGGDHLYSARRMEMVIELCAYMNEDPYQRSHTKKTSPKKGSPRSGKSNSKYLDIFGLHTRYTDPAMNMGAPLAENNDSDRERGFDYAGYAEGILLWGIFQQSSEERVKKAIALLVLVFKLPAKSDDLLHSSSLWLEMLLSPRVQRCDEKQLLRGEIKEIVEQCYHLITICHPEYIAEEDGNSQEAGVSAACPEFMKDGHLQKILLGLVWYLGSTDTLRKEAAHKALRILCTLSLAKSYSISGGTSSSSSSKGGSSKSSRSNTNANLQNLDDNITSVLATYFLFIMSNLIPANIEQSIQQQCQFVRSVREMIILLKPSDIVKFLSKIVFFNDVALASTSSKVRVAAVELGEVLCRKLPVEALCNNLSTLVVSLFPIIDPQYKGGVGGDDKDKNELILIKSGTKSVANRWMLNDEVSVYYAESGLHFADSSTNTSSDVMCILESVYCAEVNEIWRNVARRTAIQFLNGLLLSRKRDLKDAMSSIACIPDVPELADVRIMHQKACDSLSFAETCDNLCAMFRHESPQVRVVGVSELHEVCRENKEEIYSVLSSGRSSNNIATFVLRELLELVSKETDKRVLDTCAKCLGEIGAIDPSRAGMTIPTISSRNTDITSQLNHPPWELKTTDLGLMILTQHLVPGLRSATSNQDFYGFAIQFIVKGLAKKMDEDTMDVASSPDVDGYHKQAKNSDDDEQKELPVHLREILTKKNVVEVVEPFFYTRYRLSSILKNPVIPCYDTKMTYESWIGYWIKMLVQYSRGSAREYLHSCRAIYRTRPGLSQFILPYAVLAYICFPRQSKETPAAGVGGGVESSTATASSNMESNPAEDELPARLSNRHVQDVLIEICSVLRGVSNTDPGIDKDLDITTLIPTMEEICNTDSNTPHTASKSNKSGEGVASDTVSDSSMAVQAIFSLIDTLSSWAAKELRYKHRSKSKGGQDPKGKVADVSLLIPKEIVNEEGKRVKLSVIIYDLLDMIPTELLMYAALRIKAYTRAVRYFELHMRSLQMESIHEKDKLRAVKEKADNTTTPSDRTSRGKRRHDATDRDSSTSRKGGSFKGANGSSRDHNEKEVSSGPTMRLEGFCDTLPTLSAEELDLLMTIFGRLDDSDTLQGIQVVRQSNGYASTPWNRIQELEHTDDWLGALLEYGSLQSGTDLPNVHTSSALTRSDSVGGLFGAGMSPGASLLTSPHPSREASQHALATHTKKRRSSFPGGAGDDSKMDDEDEEDDNYGNRTSKGKGRNRLIRESLRKGDALPDLNALLDELSDPEDPADDSLDEEVGKSMLAIERGRLRCLIELGHLDAVVEQTLAGKRDTSALQKSLLPMGVEAAWRLSRWDTLDSALLQVNDTFGHSSSNEQGDCVEAYKLLTPGEQLLNALFYPDEVNFGGDRPTHSLSANTLSNKSSEAFKSKKPATLQKLDDVVFDAMVPEDAFQLSMGTLMLSLQKGSKTVLNQELERARMKVMSSLAAASMESYSRAYPFLTKLHILHEIEQSYTLIHNTPENDRREALKTWQWDTRMNFMTLSETHRSLSMAVRRSVLQMAEVYEEVATNWMITSKNMRQQGRFDAAVIALRSAERFGLPQNEVLSNHCRILKEQGQIHKALMLIEPVEMDVSRLKQDFLAGRSNAKAFPEYLFTPEKRNTLAEKLFLATQLMVDSKSKHGQVVQERYAMCSRLKEKWEDAAFEQARYLEDLYHDAKRKEQEALKDLANANKAATNLDYLHDVLKNAMSYTYVLDAILWYLRCLECASLHENYALISQALPRMLTTWFAFTALPSQESIIFPSKTATTSGSGRGGQSSSSSQQQSGTQSLQVRATKLREAKSSLKNNIESRCITKSRMPPSTWFMCLPQLVSNCAHPNVDTLDIITKLIQKVVVAYPQQSIWHLAGLLQSMLKQRKQYGEGIIKAARKALTQMHNQHEKMLGDASSFFHNLVQLAELNTSERKLQWRWLQDIDYHRFAIPLQDVLNSVFVSDNNKASSPKSHLSVSKIPDYAASTYFAHPLMFIQNFDAEVDVAASKAKPKTIYLTSTCGKHLQFLCKQEKHGDLRKDSRMMELNSVVNRLLTEDSEGRKRNLRLRTYAVVCLNEECGILEWVNNTTPLRKVIAESHTYYPLHFPMINKQEQQQQFTDNQMNNASNISKLTTFYREDFVCHTKPCLHRWYIHSFPDPTAWLEARNLFTHSAAVWSVVGHVVGLGDRHTENVLIDFTNGECVHVDFDCLFDKGLTLQRPEIVPFRLTANMIDAMGLLGVEGTFRRTMEVVMSLLRENRDTLLAVIEPFLRDPTVAWGRAGKAQRGEIVAAQKIGKDVPNMENADAKEALSKISGRLKGVYNLTHPHAKRIIEQYVKRKETPPLRGLGAQLDEALPLSVQGQVQRLIEEATADENLAQMYIGWQPWN